MIEDCKKQIINVVAQFGEDVSPLINKEGKNITQWLIGGLINSIMVELNKLAKETEPQCQDTSITK